jgi:hypothetical protein
MHSQRTVDNVWHSMFAAMSNGANPIKPRWFNLFTRIVYVHQAFSLAVLGSGLAALLSRGYGLHALSTSVGVVIAVATVAAMFGVAKQRSLRALTWLRVLLWASGARGLLSVLTLFGTSDTAIADFVRSMIIHEAVLLPLAIYWSRGFNAKYLASLRSS